MDNRFVGKKRQSRRQKQQRESFFAPAGLVALRGAPESITTDNGGEFAGQAMDAWAHRIE